MRRKLLIALVVVLVLCICLMLGGTGVLIWQWQNVMQLAGVGGTPTRPVASLVKSTPLPTASSATSDALARTQIPARDLYQIVPRLRKDLTLLTPVPVPTPSLLRIGDREQFVVAEDMILNKNRTATATLSVITAHSLFWVEEGYTVDPAAMQKSADLFENSIYATDTKFFGDVPPGPDGDIRINVFNGKLDQNTAGYFGSGDTFSRALFPNSNQRNIIFMSLDAAKPGTDRYYGVIAHEFQHLIHRYQVVHNAGWIDEGMSELAMRLNGFDPGDLNSFARAPDTQLNTWSSDPQANFAHYAASYLFFDYAAQRFGPDFTRAVIRAPREGVYSVQTALDQRANGMSMDDLFADWATTNYLNDASVESGRYAYANESTFRIARFPTLTQFPVAQTAQLHEYTASYFGLQPGQSDVTVYFTGTRTAKLLPIDVHAGQWMWYSNRADLANMNITRQFDLTGVSKATLQFWTWYDIEKDYDYGYVEVSKDGGKTWDTLPGKNTTTTNPGGANYGNAFTGRSGVSPDATDPARWVQEQMDLSPYAGKAILLRFEYITDDAVNLPGWAIDDIAIPELNYSDGVENGDGGWQSAGFIRVDNLLPQRFIVQIVESGNSTQIVRVPLDAQNRGNLAIAGFGKDISKAVLIVTAFAPTTTEPTEYQFGVAPK